MGKIIYSFDPIVDDKSRVLILGTMPGVESLRKQEYYGHPRNAFWPIIAAVCGRELPVSYVEKTAMLLLDGGIALWDVVSGMRARGESGQQHLQRNTERHRPTARHTSEYSDPIFQRAECRTAVQALFSRNLETQQTPHASIDQSGLHPFRSRRNATHGRSSDYANPSGQAKKSAISLRPKRFFRYLAE